MGAMNSEIKSKKWLFGGIGLQFAVGYIVSFLVFFFGSLITGESLGEAWMPFVGWAITLAIVAIVIAIIVNNKKKFKEEYALEGKKATAQVK